MSIILIAPHCDLKHLNLVPQIFFTVTPPDKDRYRTGSSVEVQVVHTSTKIELEVPEFSVAKTCGSLP